MADYRIEKDSFGELKVPQDALYQAQTQRALNNFQFSDLTLPKAFIHSLALIKSAAAQANAELGYLDEQKKIAIVDATEQILTDQYQDAFPVDVFQTGSGTSTNMNMNEVIATLALQRQNIKLHPNDDVNFSQSSNDVIPSSIHLSAHTQVIHKLLPALTALIQVIEKKSDRVGAQVKTGRTHLMDAMPVTFAQSLSSWSRQIAHAKVQISHAVEHIRPLAQGGTAVGTGVNADKQFSTCFIRYLNQLSGLSCKVSDNPFFHIATQDAIVALSGQLKTLAVAQMKIANDLRWMNSGPLAGISEIQLKPLQPGSSIMPGKVNPVIPEAVAMIAAQVIGNDATIAIAGQSGNFELNVMLPVIAYNILQSIMLLANASHALAEAIADFSVNKASIDIALNKNPILVTALNPIIGYNKAATIAKKAYASGKPILTVALEETDLSEEELVELLDPRQLTQGGIQQ